PALRDSGQYSDALLLVPAHGAGERAGRFRRRRHAARGLLAEVLVHGIPEPALCARLPGGGGLPGGVGGTAGPSGLDATAPGRRSGGYRGHCLPPGGGPPGCRRLRRTAALRAWAVGSAPLAERRLRRRDRGSGAPRLRHHGRGPWLPQPCGAVELDDRVPGDPAWSPGTLPRVAGSDG